ncbi:hypothetical protein YC2023_050101 [Brassica napus]
MNRFENSWLALSRSLDSIAHGHSAQIVLAQSLGSISRGHSLALLTRPTSRDSTLARALAVTRLDLSRSLGEDRSRAVTWLDLSRSLTRSPHSTDESSLDLAWLDLSRSLARSLYSAQIDLSQSLRSLSPHGVDVSIQQQGLAEEYPYLTHPSWLHDESSRKQLARALAVTRLDLSWSLGADRSRTVTWLDLSRALARSPYSVQNDLSQSLRSLSPRGVDVSPTSLHSTVLSSLDRRVVTRLRSHHSIDESSLDRRVISRPTSRQSIDESSLDRFVVTRSTSRHSTDESSLDQRVVTRPFCRHATFLSSLGAERSLASICAVAWLDLSRSLDSLPFGHSTLSLAVTRLSLSQSLGSDRSLAVTQIAGKSRALSIDTSSMTTCSGGSKHCPHRSFAQPSRSKKSNRNHKYVDDNSPKTNYDWLDPLSGMKTSPNPTDESSSRSFTSLLTVLGSISWRPPWGMEKYLQGRLNWSPFSRHFTDESSLDRRVVTRPTSPNSTNKSSLDRFVVTRSTSHHSTDKSSLDRQVLTRPTSPHSTDESSLDRRSVLSQSLDSICAVAWLDLSWSLAHSLYSAHINISQSQRSLSPRGVDVLIQQQGLAEAYPYLTYPSWLQDESFRKQLARALAVTPLDLSRSLGAYRSCAVTWVDLSRSLTFSPHSTDES